MAEVQKQELKNLPVHEDLHAELKAQAAEEKRPLRCLTEEILQQGLDARKAATAA